MAEIPSQKFGGYENLNLTQAEIASRSYNAGLPPSVRPINAYQNLTFKPVRLMVNGMPTEFGVDINAAGFVQWRNRDGTVTPGTILFIDYALFALAGNLGLGAYNFSTGETRVAYEPTVWITLPVGTGKFLKAEALEHNYWDYNYGTNY